MTTVTDADREAAADYFGMTNDALRADFARSGKYDLSVCVQSFARHRIAADLAGYERGQRETVARIVAWLLNVYDTGSVDGLISRSDGAEDLLRMLGEASND